MTSRFCAYSSLRERLCQGIGNIPLSKKRNTRYALIVSILTAILFLPYLIALTYNLERLQTHLFRGRDGLRAAYRAAEKADFTSAQRYFDQAHGDFADACALLERPNIRVLARVPAAGNNVRALARISSAGLEVARAGRSLSEASGYFFREQGRLDLTMAGGRIDLEPFIKARPYIVQADLHCGRAVRKFDEAPNDYLLAPIARAKEELASQLPKLRKLTSQTKQAFDILPGVLGAEGKRRYFLAVQNNAELRATGGIIGNYGILTVDNGKFELEVFDEIHVLQRSDQPPVDAPKDFLARYGPYKATSMWLNANMSPDFPTVGGVLVELYRSVAGTGLDGVISIDPVGLTYLLAATGPVRIPDMPVEISAGNVVDVTLIQAYNLHEKRAERKEFLSDVAKAVWGRIAGGKIGDASDFVDQLQRALAEGHIMLFSTHSREQRLFDVMGYAGAIDPAENDYLQVVMQNFGANKIDVYMRESIDYSVDIRTDGSALAKTVVTLTNTTPWIGLPKYVTGPDSSGARDGLSNMWVSVFVPKGARLVTVGAADADNEIEVGTEKSKTVFSKYVQVAPGASETVELVYELPDVLVFDGDIIEYALAWQAQPVINAANITVSVKAPEGFTFRTLPEGFREKGSALFYSGTLEKDEEFTVGLADNR